MKNKYLALLLVGFISMFQISCGTSNKTRGAIIGAAAGGAAGAALSKGNKAISILVGAAIGGTAGAVIGSYMDKQAAKLDEKLENAEVIRKDEGIYVSFDSGLLFDYDSYSLRPETKRNLDELATSINEFGKTKINILGHTDSTGSTSYNKDLSNNRANAVVTYLNQKGVSDVRLNSIGLGESDPLTTNETEQGRQLNRRVEVVITASEEMKKEAMTGQLSEG